jgi:hypothetical protein
MNVPPLFDLRDPGAMTPQERFSEITTILSRGLGRYVDDLHICSHDVREANGESAKVALIQLDKDAHQSVCQRDENY